MWRVFEPIAPSMGHNPAPYVIVGMMCCFGGISRAPLAIMIMVAEMTGSLSMLAPAMIAVGISWLIVRRSDATIYLSQLKSRAEAPAQRVLVGLPLLSRIPTKRAMAPPRLVLAADMLAGEARATLSDAGVAGAPVVDEEGRFQGAVLEAELEHHDGTRAVGRMVDPGAPSVPASSRLDVALEALNEGEYPWVSVLNDDRRVVGTLSISDLVRAYRRELRRASRASRTWIAGTAAFDVDIPADSPAVGMRLRSAGLPKGVLVTSITRAGDVVLPDGRHRAPHR